MIKGLLHAHLIHQSDAIEVNLKSEMFRNNITSWMSLSGEWLLSLNGMQYALCGIYFSVNH